MRRFILLLCMAVCLCACDHDERMAKDRQVVLLYLAGNNSLATEGIGDYEDIKGSWLPTTRGSDKVILVYHHFTDETPVLVRLSRDRKGNVVEDVIMEYPFDTNSASAQTLSAVIADAEAAWPSVHHGIILWSHGSGFLPPGYYAHPQERSESNLLFQARDPYADLVKSDDVKSFGEDHGNEMDLLDLQKALSRFHYDYIIFDCCLMANVELAYELRNNCNYLLFSPTEILTDGFPYDVMMQSIFTQQTEAAMCSIAQSYMAHYRAYSGVYASATICLVNTAYLQSLAEACKPIFNNHQQQILTLDRSRVQPYFRYGKHWFYDIDDFVGQVATESEYRTFAQALNRAVIFKDATDMFLDVEIKHYSGLSIYIPRSEYTVLNNYYRTLAWNKAAGLVQ